MVESPWWELAALNLFLLGCYWLPRMHLLSCPEGEGGAPRRPRVGTWAGFAHQVCYCDILNDADSRGFLLDIGRGWR